MADLMTSENFTTQIRAGNGREDNSAGTLEGFVLAPLEPLAKLRLILSAWSAGETIVEFDVTHRNYAKDEKHFAALFWLAQRRDAKKSIATRRFHLIFWVALAGLVVALVGIAVAKGWL